MTGTPEIDVVGVLDPNALHAEPSIAAAPWAPSRRRASPPASRTGTRFEVNGSEGWMTFDMEAPGQPWVNGRRVEL